MAVIGINTPGLSLGSLFAIASLSVSQAPSRPGRSPPAAITECLGMDPAS